MNALIEERIGQLHVDDLEKRKSNAKCFLAEESSFIILATGKYFNWNETHKTTMGNFQMC